MDDEIYIDGNLIGSLTIPAPAPIYNGAYEVTPTDAPQVLHTAGKLLTQDIIINPIM